MNINNQTTTENINNQNLYVNISNQAVSSALQPSATTISDNTHSNLDSTTINIETSSANVQSSTTNDNNELPSGMQRNFLPLLNEARTRLGRQTSILLQPGYGDRHNNELHRVRTAHQLPENGSNEPALYPQLRQTPSWRTNLNNVLSFSTSPSTEALRSLINHTGNFRYTPLNTRERRVIAEDNIHLLFQQDDNNHIPRTESRINGRTLRSISDMGAGASRSNTHFPTVRNASSPELSTNVRQNDVMDSNSIQNNNEPTANNHSEPNNPNNENTFDENSISDAVNSFNATFLNHFVRYLPIIGILCIKFIYDHLLVLFDLLTLHFIFHLMNKSLRKQVGKMSQKSCAIFVRDIGFIVIFVIYRFQLISLPPDPFRETISVFLNLIVNNQTTPAPTQSTLTITSTNTTGLPLSFLLYSVAVHDLELKLLTILFKNVVTLMPTKAIRHKQRGRLYVLMEYSSQFYRAYAPIHQWMKYLFESYSGLEIISGILFSTIYMSSKVFEIVQRGRSLKKAALNFVRNLDSQRRPTENELNTAGTVCPICHDNFVTPVALECNHIFCDACVNTWLKREQTCPMCRAKINIDPTWEDGSTTCFYQLC